MRASKIFIASLLVTASSGAMACDMDGMYGDRFSAFGGMGHGGSSIQALDAVATSDDAAASAQRANASVPSQPSPTRSDQSQAKLQVASGQPGTPTTSKAGTTDAGTVVAASIDTTSSLNEFAARLTR